MTEILTSTPMEPPIQIFPLNTHSFSFSPATSRIIAQSRPGGHGGQALLIEFMRENELSYEAELGVSPPLLYLVPSCFWPLLQIYPSTLEFGPLTTKLNYPHNMSIFIKSSKLTCNMSFSTPINYGRSARCEMEKRGGMFCCLSNASIQVRSKYLLQEKEHGL